VLPICPVCTTQGVETTTAAFNNFGITYMELQGTSFAAPHVAALAALILGRNPTLTPNQVYTIIAASCRPANTAEAILQASPNCMVAATTGSTGITTGRTTGTTTATTATTGTTTATTATTGTTTAATATTGTTTATTATTGTTTATTATTGTTTATTGGNTTGGVTTTTTAGTTGATTAVTTTAGLTTAGTTAGATTTGTTAGTTGTTGATTATTGATTATTGTTSGGITGATSGTITGATSGITAGTTTPVMGIGATGLTTPDTRSGFGVVDAARALALTPPLLVLGVTPANGTVTANSTPTVSFTMDAADMQGFVLLVNGHAIFQYITPTVGSPPATVSGANGITYFPATGILTFRLPFASQTLPIPQNTPITFTVQAYGGSVSIQTPQSLSTTFTIQPFTLPAGISFFGIPFGLSGNVAQPQYVFSGAQFSLARWDPTTSTYHLFPSDTFASFAPPDATSANPTVTLPPAGLGYWVDVPQNTQIHIEGVDLPATQYPIKVHAGWNQVANPFPYTIDWNGTQVLVGGQNETIAAAGTARVISSTAFTFTGRAYASLTAPSSNALAITAFQGFWVFAYQDATLLMAPNPIVSASDLL
ncbi:MAG: S8 family serine peptidase, partial [Armatimonadota bacterium]|nr:S8 family serine peptidase [Armatimonadota bacterium]